MLPVFMGAGKHQEEKSSFFHSLVVKNSLISDLFLLLSPSPAFLYTFMCAYCTCLQRSL